jgi:hypothetical protein
MSEPLNWSLVIRDSQIARENEFAETFREVMAHVQ